MKVMLFDRTDRLTPFWRAGRVLSRWDAVIPAGSWAEASQRIAQAVRKHKRPVTHLQFWGHGTEGSPLIDSTRLRGDRLTEFVEACDFRPESVVWWRACDVFHGKAGHYFAKLFMAHAGCAHVGHTRLISAPWPIFQSGGYGIRPGEEPHWSIDDDGGSGPRKPNTCLVTRMSVPDSWWQS